MDETSDGEKNAQSLFDLIFPKNLRDKAGLTDAEAGLLYGMWKAAPSGSTAFSLPLGGDKKHVVALKTKGYLAGFGNSIELTEKGKKVIVEMVTHEPNSFEKHATEISYSGIKSKKASVRPRQAFLKKQASKTVSKTFNLRKTSLYRMGGGK